MKKILAILIILAAATSAAAVMFYKEARQAEAVAARASEAETATRAGLVVQQMVKRQQLHQAWAKGWASSRIHTQIKKVREVVKDVEVKEVIKWKTETVEVTKEVLVAVCTEDGQSRNWWVEGVEAKLRSITDNWFLVGTVRVMTQPVLVDGSLGEASMFMEADFKSNATEALKEFDVEERLARWRMEIRLGLNTEGGLEAGASWYGKRRFGLWAQTGCGDQLTRTIFDNGDTMSSASSVASSCRFAGGLAVSLGRK